MLRGVSLVANAEMLSTQIVEHLHSSLTIVLAFCDKSNAMSPSKKIFFFLTLYIFQHFC